MHTLAHIFGLYHGQVVSWWRGKDLMVGFMCNTCGKISGEHITGIKWLANPTDF